MKHEEQNSSNAVSSLLEFGKGWNLKNKNKIIGYHIQKHRKSMKMTQKQLGESIGKTASSIQKYESGTTEVPLSVLEKIASVLEVHILDLLDDGSAMSWYDQRDSAMFALLKTLGCVIEIDPNNCTDAVICYKGCEYTVPAATILFNLFPDIEYNALDLVEKIIKKTSNNN